MSPMTNLRKYFAIAYCLGSIYVMGGCSLYNKCYRTVQAYNLATNIWTTVSPMNYGRRYAQAGVSGGFIYVVGGQNDERRSCNIERYDLAQHNWTKVSISKSCCTLFVKYDIITL